MSGSFSAASARGKKKELTGWALSCHSLRDHLTATMRTNQIFAGAAIADAAFPRRRCRKFSVV
jgi:hypothetical protein